MTVKQSLTIPRLTIPPKLYYIAAMLMLLFSVISKSLLLMFSYFLFFICFTKSATEQTIKGGHAQDQEKHWQLISKRRQLRVN